MKRLVLLLVVPLVPAFAASAREGQSSQNADLLRESMQAVLLRESVQDLVKIQEKGGQWPYEGVVKVKGQIPIGYRVGGTAIVATTLLYAAPKDKDAQAAIAKGPRLSSKSCKIR